MKTILILLISSFSLVAVAQSSTSDHPSMNWQGLDKGHIELGYPLLTIRGAKGFLGCGYINTKACDKTKEACAVVTGVNTHEDMLTAKVKAVSSMAQDLGIEVGMTGQEALSMLR
jgi:uncharacterized protein YunC (DUF1805 family)